MSVYQYRKPSLLDKHKAQEVKLGTVVEKPKKVAKKVEVKSKKKVK